MMMPHMVMLVEMMDMLMDNQQQQQQQVVVKVHHKHHMVMEWYEVAVHMMVVMLGYDHMGRLDMVMPFGQVDEDNMVMVDEELLHILLVEVDIVVGFHKQKEAEEKVQEHDGYDYKQVLEVEVD
jgi:hypothetical protein